MFASLRSPVAQWPALAAGLGLLFGSSAIGATLNEDGLHEEPWHIAQSFLELREDWLETNQSDRHFALIWELKGCPACIRLHEGPLQDPDIRQQLTAHFAFLQLNIIGARRVTDFDGLEMAESELAPRFGVEGTPTIQFFAQPQGDESVPREVLRVTGVPEIAELRRMLDYVQQRAYLQQDYPGYRKDLTARPGSHRS